MLRFSMMSCAWDAGGEKWVVDGREGGHSWRLAQRGRPPVAPAGKGPHKWPNCQAAPQAFARARAASPLQERQPDA